MSTNLSKLRRDELLGKIEQIRAFLNQSLHDKNAQRLAGYLNELAAEVKGKKYGLVFEEHREKIDDTLAASLPVLTEEADLFVDGGGEVHFLLEGDNLASLRLLEKTHKGKIDVIYIDPPYNTGNKDFIYDDDFVDSADSFRHSKWLSFMEKRLQIARDFLGEKGVIFISIDDNEQSDLKLLCDEIFGENNFIGLMTLMSNPRGSQNSKNLSYIHEYVLVYSKNALTLELQGVSKSEESLNEFKESDDNGRRYRLLGLRKRGGDWKKEDRPNMFYPIYVNPKTGECNLNKSNIFSEEVIPQRPTGELSRWTWGKEKFENEKSLIVGKIVNEGRENQGWDIFRKDYIDNSDGVEKQTKLKSIWIEKETNYQNAKNEMKDIFGNSEIFNFPKPTYIVSRLTSIFPNKSATVLDFFAGSGTTGHAVLKLNAEDGGHRRFILCTNNENGICRNITYERLRTVITGKRRDGSAYSDGLPGSLKYFRVDFVPVGEKEYYEYADRLLLHVRELVELENAVNFFGNARLAIVLTEEEAALFFAQVASADTSTVKTLYLGHDVLLSKAQKAALKRHGIGVKIIPQYYYPELNG